MRFSNYAVAFFITAAIFGTAFFASNFLSNRRIVDIQVDQDTMSTDILSLETQFDLLQEHSCDGITENTVLPTSLRSLADKLSYMEAHASNNDPDVTRLKRLYSLLEIKDYLLMTRIAAKCKLRPVFVLYFYSNKGDCSDCEKQGYALTALATKYPQVRIYSFDYDLDVGALKTLIATTPIKRSLPALYMQGDTYYGFENVTDIDKAIPQLAKMASSTLSTSSGQAAATTKSISK